MKSNTFQLIYILYIYYLIIVKKRYAWYYFQSGIFLFCMACVTWELCVHRMKHQRNIKKMIFMSRIANKRYKTDLRVRLWKQNTVQDVLELRKGTLSCFGTQTSNSSTLINLTLCIEIGLPTVCTQRCSCTLVINKSPSIPLFSKERSLAAVSFFLCWTWRCFYYRM